MIKIYLDNQPFEKPESWADVPSERLPDLLRLLYFTPESGSNYLEIIRLALNAKPGQWKKLMQKHFSPNMGEKAREANAVVLHGFYQSLNWMETEPIHKQPFPYVEVEQVRFIGPNQTLRLILPEERFLTMSFGELTDAYIHFLAYIRQLVPGNEQLNLLIATLCRPERSSKEKQSLDWNGDAREPYNEYIVKERASLVAGLDEAVKMAILLYFAGNIKTVLDQYTVVGEGDGEPEAYPAQGLVKNGHLLAEKGIFGTLQQTKATNVHEVLLFLEEHRNDLLAEAERNQAEA